MQTEDNILSAERADKEIYHGGNKKILTQILDHSHISFVFVCSSSRRFVICVIGAIHVMQQPAGANEEGGVEDGHVREAAVR